MAPLEEWINDKKQLIVVPYAALHYLPFNTLHNGESYVIENHEIVMLPAAGLLTQTPVERPAGALILAHSHHGTLPQVIQEAEMLSQFASSTAYVDQDACRRVLDAPPCQILHIAAHGDYRIDEPDLSYIQLEDGQLFTDDLLQCDLSYELVVLSACETGHVHLRPSEDLDGPGLGRSVCRSKRCCCQFMARRRYLHQVTDARSLYGIMAGLPKAQALQQAQVKMLRDDLAHQHPAFWGAFHLIGNPEPLSPN